MSATVNTRTIDWQAIAGTVYGGTLTVNDDGSGTLTATLAEVDLGTLEWTRQEPTASYPYGYFTSVALSGKKPGRDNILCSCYPVGDVKTDKSIVGNASSVRIYVVDSSYTDAPTFTTAMSGVQLVYELATPVVYTLTPADVGQILTQIGRNNIWADTGPVTLRIVN